MRTYIFFREQDGKRFFYAAEYKNDEDAAAGAMHNKGTVKVENLNGEVIWPLPQHQN